MTFTDEDLKRLIVEIYRQSNTNDGIVELSVNMANSLLARLEAAEDLIGIPIGSTTWKDREASWLRSKGLSDGESA